MKILFQVHQTPAKLSERSKVVFAREITYDDNVKFPFDELVKVFSVLYPANYYSFTFNICKL